MRETANTIVIPFVVRNWEHTLVFNCNRGGGFNWSRELYGTQLEKGVAMGMGTGWPPFLTPAETLLKRSL